MLSQHPTVLLLGVILLTTGGCSAATVNCDFETADLCGYIQDATDDQDWTRHQGATKSPYDTGPKTDHTVGTDTGSYMYLEGSNSVRPNHTANLQSPPFLACSGSNITFWYHMFGNNRGSLSVYSLVYDSGSFNSSSQLWTLSGNQKDAWELATILLPDELNRRTASLVFEARKGYGFYSDIAIDDIKLYNTSCVEETTSSATPTLDIQKTSHLALSSTKIITTTKTSSSTPASVPVNKDSTSANVASTSANFASMAANTTSLPSSISFTTASIASKETTQVTPLDSTVRQTSPTTHKQAAPFTVTKRLPNPSTSPSSVSVNCDFESPTVCGYSQSMLDVRDWTRHQGPTDSQRTGPSNDHTFGNSSGHYMYLEASQASKNTNAFFWSPSFIATSGDCLNFWYHMYGVGIGSLKVYVKNESVSGILNSLIPIWTLSGDQNNEWKSVKIIVPSKFDGDSVNIGFEATIRNYMSDTAIDDIKLFKASYCIDETTKSTSPKTSTSSPPTAKITSTTANIASTTAKTTSTTGNIASTIANIISTSSNIASTNASFGSTNANIVSSTADAVSTTSKLSLSTTKSGSTTVEIASTTASSTTNNPSSPANIAPLLTNTAFTPGNIAHTDTTTHSTPLILTQRTTKQQAGSSAITHPSPPLSTSIPLSVNCDFENDNICGYTQLMSNPRNWTRQQGPTPSVHTGPSVDHTFGNTSGHYMFLTGWTAPPGLTSYLKSPAFIGRSEMNCLSFWYHMYGVSIGNLTVNAENYLLWIPFWTISGNQNDKWKLANILMPSNFYGRSVNLVFEATIGENYMYNNYMSDIALDDIKLINSSMCITENQSTTGSVSLSTVKKITSKTVNPSQSTPQVTLSTSQTTMKNQQPSSPTTSTVKQKTTKTSVRPSIVARMSSTVNTSNIPTPAATTKAPSTVTTKAPTTETTKPQSTVTTKAPSTVTTKAPSQLTLSSTNAIHLTSDPLSIIENFTSALTINCTFQPKSETDFSTLVSLVISMTSDPIKSRYTELATITAFSGDQVSVTDAMGGHVTGFLHANEESYISVQWDYPGEQLVGSYKCEGFGMDYKGHPRASSDINHVIAKDTDCKEILPKFRENDMKLKALTTNLERSRRATFEASSTFGNHSYHISRPMARNSELTESLCLLFNGVLAEIDNKSEMDFVTSFINSTVADFRTLVIGGNDQEHKGQWVYQGSGNLVTYFDWADTEPTQSVNEECLFLDGSNGFKMDDSICNGPSIVRVLCELFE